MTKVINQTEKDYSKLINSKDVRSLGKYVRSHGEYRDGLTTTTDGGALVPNQILGSAKDLSSGKFQLKPYLNYIPVKTAKGDYPVMNPNATASTKAELAKYPDIDSDIDIVPFKINTYAGRLQISNELLQDEAFPIMPMLSQQLATVMVNTQNKAIADKMATLPATNISSLDDLINAIEDVDPRFQSNIYVGQNAYAKLRTTKNKNGDYLLKANDNSLLGIPLTVMPSYIGNANDVFVGNLGVAMAYFDRMATTLNYNNRNLFAESLAAILRFDVELTYPKALKHLTFNAGATK